MIRITCLVENSVKLSTRLWGEHGMSILIETGDETVLFDTGQSGDVLLHNLQELQIDPYSIDKIILSHGHYDHTGGLEKLLDLIGPRPIYGHPDLFNPRYSERPDGSPKPVSIPFDKQELDVVWHLSAEQQQVVTHVYTTGEIPRLEPLEDEGDERLKVHRDLADETSPMIKDPLKDDMSVIVKTANGLVILLGCCHAGVLNTLAQIRKQFPDEPIHAVMGGTHLAKAGENRLIMTENALQGVPRIGLSHCTGPNIIARFLCNFPEQAFVFQVGTQLTFN
ncbi:MBL fold metallo-hydrolase [Thiomicrorhabdus heinhorstiae]|uniref:MBL fold metallo-hydrolase n=1 Tax=Thiomicrorhabdus heinhorstiae TaxID=2748010 RepID=A0ABS0BYJ8_9GAMM|nr:MBL fold metallo-hydrolase [Thiomicrorhabdus heinhorstiae]MBF6058867.1 MBL fold metallo-hydrolase [Thiomicrorhabdus heinhorstiae]